MTLRFAVIGQPIAHSLSPQMHAAALQALGVAATYEAIEVGPDALAAFVARVRAGEFQGANVTLPLKTHVVPLLDAWDSEVRGLGAVNTLIYEARTTQGVTQNIVRGVNTDVLGIVHALTEHGVSMDGRNVIILGTGGAAAAAAHAAGDAENVEVVGRRNSPARGALATLHYGDGYALREAFAAADVVLQMSSATMGADADAFVKQLPMASLRPGVAVLEAVYRPRETAFLRAARARGCVCIDGVGMLVHQGAVALSRWLRRPAEDMPIEVMREAVLRALG
jgi:shikimate dehydrogenase